MKSKRVLLLVPADSSYKRAIGAAFKNLGWDVLYFDYRKGDLPIRIFRFIPLIGGPEKAKRKIEEKIIRIVSEYRPKVVLVAKGEAVSKRILLGVKHYGCVTANLFPDYLNHWPVIKEISRYYDFFFTFDQATIKRLVRLKRKNIYYMPQATDPEEDIGKEKIYDITFIGTYNKWRENYLSSLKRFNLNIWGDQRWFNSSLKKFTRGGRMKLFKMKDIIKRSKINLNIFFDDETPMEGVSLRPYEITGSGGFLLTQYVKDYDNVFVNDKEIVYFKTPQEMVDKVKFYLKNDEDRGKIAYAGYLKTLKDHTYEKRMKQMLEIIKKKKLLK